MWRPLSLNLNPHKLNLWAHLKSLAQNRLPNILDDLKVNIERELQIILIYVIYRSIIKKSTF